MSDKMCHHFMNKNIPEFWKTWNAKFIKDLTKNVNISGYVTDTGIRMLLQLILRMSFTVRMITKPMMSSYVNVMNVLRLTRSRVMDMLIRYLLNLLTIVSRN